jgi:hypothetical protein
MAGPGRTRSLLRNLVALIALAPAASYAQTVVTDPPVTPAKDVNVVNTPTVQVVNVPNVTVANTPNVNVSNVPNVKITSMPVVTVASGEINPVSVRSVDDPARHAFQTVVALHFAAGEFEAKQPFSIPAGKRLVIEFVTVGGTFVGDQRLDFCHIGTRVNNVYAVHTITPPFATPIFFGTSVRLYADGGDNAAEVELVRNSGSGTSDPRVAISGYLVDMP